MSRSDAADRTAGYVDASTLTIGIGGAGLTGSGATSDVTAEAVVESSVASTGSIASSGALLVKADAVKVEALHIGNKNRATANMGSTGASLIRIEANATNDSTPRSDAIAGGLVGVNSSNADADITSGALTLARLGSGSVIASPNASVVVQSTAGNTAFAKTENTTGGFVASGSANPTANSNCVTKAELAGSVVVDAVGEALAGANAIEVLANGVDAAISEVCASGGGAVNVDNSNGIAKTAATTGGTLGSSGSRIVATGDITLWALGTTDADATTTSTGGGAIDVKNFGGQAQGDAKVDVKIGGNSLIHSKTGLVSISADHNVPTGGSTAVCTVPLSDNVRMTGALTLERGGDQPFTRMSRLRCVGRKMVVECVGSGRKAATRRHGPRRYWIVIGRHDNICASR